MHSTGFYCLTKMLIYRLKVTQKIPSINTRQMLIVSKGKSDYIKLIFILGPPLSSQAHIHPLLIVKSLYKTDV